MVQEIVRIFAPRDAPSLITHAVTRLVGSIDLASGIDAASYVSGRAFQFPERQLKQRGCVGIAADDSEPTIADAEYQLTQVAGAGGAFSASGETPSRSGARLDQNFRGHHPG